MANPAGKTLSSFAEDIEESYPLSPMQQGMLFNTLRERDSGVDVEQMLFELDEAVDATALRGAWNRALMRHPVLRTGIQWRDLPEPRQNVRACVELPWQELDWSGIPGVELERETDRYLNGDRRQGFELSSAPLFRLALLRLDASRYRLVWTLHHAILDGRSFALLLREVFEDYDASRENRECAALAPRPYRDYVDWLQKRDAAADERFWRTALTGFTAPTPLVIDHAPIAADADLSPKGSLECALEAQVARSLGQIAGQNGFSVHTIVQGAWALLLHRYSGESDVMFGVIRANRRSSMDGADTMVGLFINTLPLRISVNPAAALVPWLQDVHGRWNAIRGHEHASLSQVHAWSGVPRGSPLFNTTVMFDVEDLDSVMRKQGAAWSRRRIRTYSQTNYAIDLAAYGGDGLRLRIDFDRSRIGADAASRLLGHLHTLLEGMARDPGATLGELPLLTDAERRRITHDWNATATAYPPDTLLHHFFEAQCRRTPHAVEVICEGRQLTNRELEARSNQLARFLQARGIGPDVLVAVCMDRSVEMVIGILGVLKAGGAYVPVDPGLPADRIAHIVRETGTPIALTLDRFREQLEPILPRMVCLDSDWDAIARRPSRRPASRARPGNLAYAIYTSGSTGLPKGVLISHAAICNHMHWMKRVHGLSTHDVELQKSPFGFDASVWEFFAPLMSDAHLVMLRPDGHLDSTYLAEMIRAHRVSTLQVVPSQLRMLMDEPAFLECDSSLRRVYCGGEPLSRDLCQAFADRFPEARLYNMYGPTEGSIDSTWWICPRHDIPASIPIGRPIDNVRAYVVDPQLQLLPVGVPGELLIGGAGLARGYLNDPQLTAKRFLPDPFCGIPGERVYRTGDRVRYLADGNIEFLGRLDHQVKIRGFRIEPGEIEADLAAHPLVREAVVIAHEFAALDVRLVAYVVAEKAPADLAEQLRQALRTKVPQHMIPAYIVVLDALPLTSAGKVDRKRLPIPQHSTSQESSRVPPRTPMEEALAAIWREVLRLEDIGVRDNFFDLGGHSLLLARLVARINKVYRVGLGIPDIIRNPTIEEVAKEIDRQRPENAPLSTVVPIQGGNGGLPVYFIYAGPAEFRIAQGMGAKYPVFGLEARWPMAWRSALAENRTADFPNMRQMVSAYASALRAHAGTGRCALAGLSYGGLIAFEVAHQFEEMGGEVDAVFLVDTQARPPNPYRLAWQTWREDWRRSAAGLRRLGDLRAVGAHLGKFWQSTRWVLQKARRRLTSVVSPPDPDLETLTSILDEQGAPMPWGLVDRLYHEIDKTYYPRQLDSRGVLLRTSEIEGRKIIAPDEAHGWENAFSRGLEIVPLSGGHYSIFKEHIPAIARTMDRVLDLEMRAAGDKTGGDAGRR